MDRYERQRQTLLRIQQEEIQRVPSCPLMRFSDAPKGQGIYMIYYWPTEPVELRYLCGQSPIYVGKAGGKTRTGKRSKSNVCRRLGEHFKSIQDASNLSPLDFDWKAFLVPEEFVSVQESLAIQSLLPIWNVSVAGFGNHAPGKGRYEQHRSDWDILHPGRRWTMRLPVADGAYRETRIRTLRASGILAT